MKRRTNPKLHFGPICFGIVRDFLLIFFIVFAIVYVGISLRFLRNQKRHDEDTTSTINQLEANDTFEEECVNGCNTHDNSTADDEEVGQILGLPDKGDVLQKYLNAVSYVVAPEKIIAGKTRKKEYRPLNPVAKTLQEVDEAASTPGSSPLPENGFPEKMNNRNPARTGHQSFVDKIRSFFKIQNRIL